MVSKRVFVITTFFGCALIVTGVAQPTYIERSQDARKQDAAPRPAAAQIGQCDSPDPDRAIVACSAFIRTNREVSLLSKAYINRGLAHEKRGEPDLARVDLDQAIRADPKNPDAFNARGNSYLLNNDFTEAVADYNKAIALNPRYASPYANRGEAHRLQGEDDLAIADYNQAIKLDAKNAGTFFNRGVALQDQGDYVRAIADFSQAIKLNSKYVAAYDKRASAYEYTGAHDKALADIARAIKLDPQHTDQHHLQ